MLYLDHVEVVGLDYSPKYFGGIVRYSIDKNITIRGKSLDLTNSSGISGVWSGMQNISHNRDYDQIVLNGRNFGSGKINSVNFDDATTDVRQKSYTMNLTVQETGNLYNLNINGGGDYSNIVLYAPEFIESLDENLSYNKGNDGQSVYNHNISIAYRSGVNISGSPKSLAQKLASGLFLANNITGTLGLYDEGYNSTYSERYNEITQSCEFNKTYNFYRPTGNYSLDYSHSFNLDNEGILNVTEEGKIRRLVGTAAISALYDALQDQIAQSYTRSNEIALLYFPTIELKSTPIEKRSSVNTFGQDLTYSVDFTSDLKINNNYSWEYTIELTQNNDGVTILSEKGTVIGFGRLNIDKYTNANDAFETIQKGILNRLQAYYNNIRPLFNNIRVTKKQKSINKYNGIIEYEWTASDDLTLRGGDIRKIEIVKDISYPVHLKNTFGIINFKEIAQPTKNATVGIQTTTVTLFGNRNLAISSFLSKAKQQVENPDGDDIFLQDASYTFDPETSKFELNVIHHFHGSKSFDSNTVNYEYD